MMLYITYGTVNFLENLLKKHDNKQLRLMTNPNTAVMFQETDGPSIFYAPSKYEVLYSNGSLSNGSFAVTNNIPVSYEGRPLFESKFSDQARQINNAPGNKAVRVLRPSKGDTYIILTLWENEPSFKTWQDTMAEIEQQSTFPRPSYLTKYFSVDIEI
jgi:heme oxygenase (mycobilin-producing)